MSSQHISWEHFPTLFTLETPSKPQASLHLFCSRPYAEHKGTKWKKTQPLISAAPSLLHQFSKAASQSCVSQNAWWEMGSHFWGPQGTLGAGSIQAEKLSFWWKTLIQKKGWGTHRPVDLYFRFLNMWIQQSLLNSLYLTCGKWLEKDDRVMNSWSPQHQMPELLWWSVCYLDYCSNPQLPSLSLKWPIMKGPILDLSKAVG